MTNDEYLLWTRADMQCVMISCCAGAELQLRRIRGADDYDVVVRELYPTKSDLYERSDALHLELDTTLNTNNTKDTGA